MTDYAKKQAVAEPVSYSGLTQGHANPPGRDKRRERRAYPRHSVIADAKVIEIKTQAQLGGRCTDLSMNGCYVDIINPFPIGSLVVVRLRDKKKTFESPARVVYAKMGMGMGLSFYDTAAEQRRSLHEWATWVPDDSPPAEPAAEPGKARPETPSNDRLVLDQLINTLVRKRVLTDEEGAILLDGLGR
jgi:hypothetical protein